MHTPSHSAAYISPHTTLLSGQLRQLEVLPTHAAFSEHRSCTTYAHTSCSVVTCYWSASLLSTFLCRHCMKQLFMATRGDHEENPHDFAVFKGVARLHWLYRSYKQFAAGEEWFAVLFLCAFDSDHRIYCMKQRCEKMEIRNKRDHCDNIASMAHRSRQLDRSYIPPIQTLAKKKHVYIWHCCYCGKSSIPISSAGCPGCGYGRCAYCTTTRVQVRASAAKSQLQKADSPALSIRALSRPSGYRPLSSSNAYKIWVKPPAPDMDIHPCNQQAFDTNTVVCSGAPLQQIVSGAELCEERRL
ncbi:unnamed protein product [Alternaria burnsii]|nr:unnamed protein product [Alternaria burnsii]